MPPRWDVESNRTEVRDAKCCDPLPVVALILVYCLAFGSPFVLRVVHGDTAVAAAVDAGFKSIRNEMRLLEARVELLLARATCNCTRTNRSAAVGEGVV